MMSMRVILYPNGSNTGGKVVPLPDSLDGLHNEASRTFGFKVSKLYTTKGGEIDDVGLIRDDEVLFVSAGEPFLFACPSPSTSVGCAQPKHNAGYLGSAARHHHDWVTLNVGGKHFSTTRGTLTTKAPHSMLARMFADEDGNPLWPSVTDLSGAFLIDRSPHYFEPILNFLRHGQMILDNTTDPQGVLEEAKFFGIETVIPHLESAIQENQKPSENFPLGRMDVISALMKTSHNAELRFQGIDLSGSDLSRLDLRNINLKYANLQGAKLMGSNLAFCCLERADLSHANLEGAILLGAKMLCAVMEGANLKTCNFEDPAGSRANLEGVNLKCANLEGSQMASVNLRVATLKHANLQNCDLRGACLAGADLENCNLSGSDLHEANLRGANLKGAAFELMLTPLHMSQTIR